MSNLGGSNLGGGPYNGYSPKQTINNYKDSRQVCTRRILRQSWNGNGAAGVQSELKRRITPFRAVTNSGDFLSRQNYVCGGPNLSAPLNTPRSRGNLGGIFSVCDGTGVPAASCNTKYVYDSSDYTKYRNQKAHNLNYNDIKNGGDEHNASYTFLMRVRR
jgi:hypothetical protein